MVTELEKKCFSKLPKEFQKDLFTFYMNQELSCGANTIIHSLPHIGELALHRVDEKDRHNMSIVGRTAYEILAEYFGKEGPAIASKDFTIPSSSGSHSIPLRRYQGTSTNRTILFIHGGGWSRGNLKTHDQLCRKVVDATGYNLVAVDYRLAPENPFPAGLNDAADAYEWVMAQSDLSHDIIVMGDSGGGNISTALILQRIQKNLSLPKGAALIYPALDLRVPETTDDPYAVGHLLTQDSINAYVHNYLGDEHRKKALEPLVSPLLADDADLKKFPPCVIIAAQCDPLTRSITAFTKRLAENPRPIHFKVIPSTIHIFAQFFDVCDEAQDSLDFIKQHLMTF